MRGDLSLLLLPRAGAKPLNDVHPGPHEAPALGRRQGAGRRWP